MVVVEKMSILKPIFLFIGYIVLHVVIMLHEKTLEKEHKKDEKNLSNAKLLAQWHILNKWFPALYLIATILILVFL